MFGSPPVSHETLREALKDIYAEIGAIKAVLAEREITTIEILEKVKLQAVAVVDQKFAEAHELAEKEFREENPEAARAIDFMKQMLGITE